MDKRAVWKWAFLVMGIVFSMAIVLKIEDGKVSLNVPLGLDLQGGSSFVVQIEEAKLEQKIRDQNEALTDAQVDAMMPEAIKDAQLRAIQVIRGRIDGLGIAEPNIYAERNNRIVIQLPGIDSETQNEAERRIKEVGYLTFQMVHKNNEKLVTALMEDKKATPEGYIIETVKDKNNRAREYYVPIPDLKNRLSIEDLNTFHAPPGYHFKLMRDQDVIVREAYLPVFVNQKPELTGNRLESAIDVIGMTGEALIKIKFDNKGKVLFKQITKYYGPRGQKNVNSDRGRRLGILLDDKLYSAPELRSVIYDGEAQIEGIGTAEEARRLAGVLQAGSLEAPVVIVEKHKVDASLGKDAIESGIKAVMYGGIAVLVFMLFYYMVGGVVADIALGLDLLLLPLGMVLAAGFLGIFASGAGAAGSIVALPVLTLPGIAGILLTIGMAVDANVLIFERIREEARAGKTIRAAIAAGYDRAFVTIVDANVTTLLTAIILFIAGSGPVRGFAVTLSGGILVSMFTALVVTRLILDLICDKTRITKLRMLSVVGQTKINFIGFRGVAAVVSILLICGTWAGLVMSYQDSPGNVLGVDFTGGSSVTFRVGDNDAKPGVSEVRDALSAADIDEAHIQYKNPLDTSAAGQLMIRVGVGTAGSNVEAAIKSAFAVEVLSDGIEEEVGPQVGEELTKTAIYAIIFALIGIILYITWRFEFGFAVGAIAALAHDVFVTVGVYVILGHQISLPIVAALLTIVGYSVNDTIVVFDRIRENLKDSEKRRNMTYREICNISLNQTLSRTILTSLTTLIAVAMLLVFGGGAINDFALALCVGVVAGTYSSIFVATPVMLFWHKGTAPITKKS